MTTAHLDTALAYVGVAEIGENRGPEVEKFLASVGLPTGLPWCAAFVSYCLSAASVKVPPTRSGRAVDFITRRSISARDVLRGTAKIPAGAVIVWRRGDGMSGHAGFAIRQTSTACMEAIEGNYTDTVALTTPCIEPTNYFRITHFTTTIYE